MACSFQAYCVLKEYVVFNLLCPFLWQAKLQVGDVVKCCIKKITYFGVFVEVTEKFSTHFLGGGNKLYSSVSISQSGSMMRVPYGL